MQVKRAYGSKAMRRRAKDVVRPKDVLGWWQQAHGYLKPPSRERFLRHPATKELCSYPLLSVKSAVTVEKTLAAALDRVQRQVRGYNSASTPVAGAAVARANLPSSRSTWLGGDIEDLEVEKRRAEERRLARPEVDRPEPYL